MNVRATRSFIWGSEMKSKVTVNTPCWQLFLVFSDILSSSLTHSCCVVKQSPWIDFASWCSICSRDDNRVIGGVGESSAMPSRHSSTCVGLAAGPHLSLCFNCCGSQSTVCNMTHVPVCLLLHTETSLRSFKRYYQCHVKVVCLNDMVGVKHRRGSQRTLVTIIRIAHER